MARLAVDFYSRSLGFGTHMNVILPENTGNKKLKTLYLLHGRGDDCSSWLRNTSIERYSVTDEYVSCNDLAIVLPGAFNCWYSDCMGGKYLEFVSEELPKITREMFPQLSCDREDTFICGNSMGGYGALKCAFANPETFGYAVSLSGVMNIGFIKRWQEDVEFLGGRLEGSENDILLTAKKLAESGDILPKLYQWCGFDDVLYNDNLAAEKLFLSLGFELTSVFTEGSHNWGCWDEQIKNVLKWLPTCKKSENTTDKKGSDHRQSK